MYKSLLSLFRALCTNQRTPGGPTSMHDGSSFSRTHALGVTDTQSVRNTPNCTVTTLASRYVRTAATASITE